MKILPGRSHNLTEREFKNDIETCTIYIFLNILLNTDFGSADFCSYSRQIMYKHIF